MTIKTFYVPVSMPILYGIPPKVTAVDNASAGYAFVEGNHIFVPAFLVIFHYTALYSSYIQLPSLSVALLPAMTSALSASPSSL